MTVNRVYLIGRVGRDPETRSLANGSSVVNFSIATSERFTKDGEKVERTEWHNCVAFGRQAEVISQYVKKGSQLYVEGSLRTRDWEKDGVKHYRTEIVLSSFSFLGSKEYDAPSKKPEPKHDDFDDEIPFN